MAECFVMRKDRRLGIGRRAAAAVFTTFPGHWKARQQVTNPTATAFWRKAIPKAFTERATPDEIIQEFTSQPE